jgi:hypothetical protein
MKVLQDSELFFMSQINLDRPINPDAMHNPATK